MCTVARSQRPAVRRVAHADRVGSANAVQAEQAGSVWRSAISALPLARIGPVARSWAWPRSALLSASIALLCALAARLPYFFRSDFPLNDGGMFLTMTREVLEARFALPGQTGYNFEAIPFAYP